MELLFDLGLRVMQVTYKNQKEYGGSCYEDADSGLSRTGRVLVREMNHVGMVIDLSHVESGPVATSSRAPNSRLRSPTRIRRPWCRIAENKSDDFLRAPAQSGGVLGLATYRNIAGEWIETVERLCGMVARTVEMMGVEHVGIGTDAEARRAGAQLDASRPLDTGAQRRRRIDRITGESGGPGVV